MSVVTNGIPAMALLRTDTGPSGNVGFQELTPLNPYDALWRSQRTLLKHALSAEVIHRDYAAVLENTAKRLVERLLAQPDSESFAATVKRFGNEKIWFVNTANKPFIIGAYRRTSSTLHMDDGKTAKGGTTSNSTPGSWL